MFTAAFDSDCANCDQPVKRGQKAEFQGTDVVHVKCPTPPKACPVCYLIHGISQEPCEDE